MLDVLGKISSWFASKVEHNKTLFAAAAIGILLPGLAGFVTVSISALFHPKPPKPVPPVEAAQPFQYSRWSEVELALIQLEMDLLVSEQQLLTGENDELVAEEKRLASAVSLSTRIGDRAPPQWPVITIYSFAYAVDYFSQGDGTKHTFFVSCAGRWNLPVCQTTAKARELNHLHYTEWLQLPQR